MWRSTWLALAVVAGLAGRVRAGEAQALKDARKLGGFGFTVDGSRPGKPVVALFVCWTRGCGGGAGLDGRAVAAAADAFMTKVAGFSALKELTLRIPVTDAGLKHLAGLSKLHTLRLRTGVTDAGLRHL